jgi:type I site-specific restriction-modification system R (restriction) subunit
MSIVGTTEKDEWIKSEQPAIQQLIAMGYEYKNQNDLNKSRKDYREVLLYDRLEAAIRKHNPELDEDGVHDALSERSRPGKPCYPSKVDLERLGIKAQGKTWEI